MGPPYPYPSRPTRLSCSSTATHSNSSDPSRRNIHRKENQFVDRNGSKLHAYDREKAPYPSSFDDAVIELYAFRIPICLVWLTKIYTGKASTTPPCSTLKESLPMSTSTESPSLRDVWTLAPVYVISTIPRPRSWSCLFS